MLKKFSDTLTLKRSHRPKSELWLKLDGKQMKKPYHCVWPPFTESRPHIDWTSLTTREVTYPHIRLYELSMEDSLSTFLSFIDTLSSIPATMAIILINTEESYDLDEKFNSRRGDTPVPIVVVKRKAGLGLQEQLRRYPRNVLARIEGDESGNLEIPRTGDSPEKMDNKASPAADDGTMALSPEPKDESTYDLQVRVKSESEPQSHTFQFSLGRLHQTPPNIDWIALTTTETTFPHVRLHELKAEDSLSYFMATLSSIPAARAMILINQGGNYELSAKFHTEDQGPPVPMLVVTKETGRELLRLVKENPREVEVKVGASESSSPGSLVKEKKKTIFAGPDDESNRNAEEDTPGVVKNGLKLRMKSVHTEQCHNFNYSFGPFRQSLRSINWVDITATETTYHHVRLHELKEEDSLSYFLSMMASIPATMAVILINSENSYRLSDKFHTEDQSPPVPMLVITKETGRELLRLVRDHPRQMEARVDLSPGMNPQPTTPSTPGSSMGFIVSPVPMSPEPQGVGPSQGASPVVTTVSPQPQPSPPTPTQRTSHVVAKGLQLKVTSESKTEYRRFDYTWGVFTQSARSIIWTPITTTETTFPHVRLHELKTEDSLSYFMATLSSIPAATAMILINTDDSYRLPENLVSEDQCPPVPMLVVTKETGRELLRLVKENPREVEVRVQLSSLSTVSATKAPPVVTYQEGSGGLSMIENGLQVQLSNKTGPPLCFDFGWGTFKQSLRSVRLLPLTASETTYQHVRLHELKEEDSLSYFLSMMASIPATMAVILINSENSYRLSDKFHTEDQCPPVPMLVVTKETGRELLRLVKENPREVEVEVVLPQSLPQSLPFRPQSSMSGSTIISVTSPVEDGPTPPKGLHLKVGSPGAEHYFEYGQGPFRQMVHSIGWTDLTTAETTYPHIRLHELTKEDSLSYFLTTMASIPATMAVILINSENSYRLSDKFHTEDQSPPVPMLVVTKETGRELLRLVKDNPRKVKIKIDLLSHEEQIEKGGLQVQLSKKKESQPFKFDFGWGAFNQTPRAIQWMPLTPTEATYQHIRLRELQDEDSLSDFLITMASIPATMAVILINSENSYRLSDKFHTEDQSPPVPMLVVTKETGRELQRLVKENPREVEVRVETSFRGLSTPYILSAQTTPDHSLKLLIGESGHHDSGENTVKRGVTVKLPTEETHYFDYAWPPFSQTPRPLDWVGLAQHQVTYPHIQLYQLRVGDSLSYFMSTLGSMAAAKALMLVNTTNSLQVDQKCFLTGQTPPVPTLVITKQSGERMLEFVKRYGRDVQVRVQCSPTGETATAEREPAKEEAVKSKEEGIDENEWDVIPSPMESIRAGDTQSISTLEESLPMYSAVTDGLQVRSHKGTKTKNTQFDYVHATFSTAKISTDWLKLVFSNSIPKNTGNHMCLHELKKRDKNLSTYDSLLRSPQLKVLVLVNTCNSYKIPKKYRRKTGIPVVIVTEGTGQALNTLLKECKGNVEAMLEKKSSEQERPFFPFGGERTPSPEKTSQPEQRIEWADAVRLAPKVEDKEEETRTAGEDRFVPESEVHERRRSMTREESPLPVIDEREEAEERSVKQEIKPPSVGVEGEVREGQEETPSDLTEPQLQPVPHEEREEMGGPGRTLEVPVKPDHEVEQSVQTSIGEFMLVEQQETEHAATADDVPKVQTMEPVVAASPPRTPSPDHTPDHTQDHTYDHTPDHTSGHTPDQFTPPHAAAEPQSTLPFQLDGSQEGFSTMPPPQEMVPYNPGPYTGDMLGPPTPIPDHLEGLMSGSDRVSDTGEHVASFMTSSGDSDWRGPIKNGLQVKAMDQGSPQYFTYQWSQVTDYAQQMDWITLTDQEDFPDEHIRLYQLTQDSDLPFLMAVLDDSPAACLLLINNKNTYDIDGKFFPVGVDGWPVPVMVITADAGKKIKSLIKGSKSGVEAHVDTTSQEPPRGRVASFLKYLGGGRD